MVTKSLSRLTLAVSGLALSCSAVLAVGAPIAAAAPDLGPIVNTPCSYSQVIAALNAENPSAAANFNSSPMAQGFLQSFLSSPPDKRQRIAMQVQAMPEAQQYIGTINQVANSCTNY